MSDSKKYSDVEYNFQRFTYVGINSRSRKARMLKRLLRVRGKFCSYCSQPMSRDNGFNSSRAPSRDHIIPRCRGGKDVLENITLACRGCNEKKGALTGEEYMAWLEGRASRLDRKRRRTITSLITTESVIEDQSAIVSTMEMMSGLVEPVSTGSPLLEAGMS